MRCDDGAADGKPHTKTAGFAGHEVIEHALKLGFIEPDAIVTLPEIQQIPATGVLDYRHIKIKAPFDRDVWVKGVIAKPQNTRVVHHIIVRVREPGQRGDNPDDAFLIGWAPGASPRSTS